MKRLFLLTAMAAGCVIATPASAGDTSCVGVLTGSFDNVIVPPGADCTLLNSFVDGSVKNFGALGVNRSIVRGNVEGEPGNHHTAVFNFSFVRGNVTIKGATNAAFGSGVFASTVGGDVEYVESMGNRLDLFFSTIGGNVKSEKNFGGGFIVSNTINGNLECKENTPPHSNTGNTVRGNNKCPE